MYISLLILINTLAGVANLVVAAAAGSLLNLGLGVLCILFAFALAAAGDL